MLVEGNVPDQSLEREVADLGLPRLSIGDCLIARSAEEAIYDGLVRTRDFLGALAAPAIHGD